MPRRLTLLLLTTLFLGSCAPATASPTPPVTATATQTVAPSETPPPTQTAIPTTTPYPPLQTEGPYLLFTYDNNNFTIMDADGSGRKQFKLPNGGYMREVSPDGKWLAYYTGTIEEKPYDLALNLYDLENHTSFLIANLVAPGFPENLEPVTKTIDFTDFPADCSHNPKCQLGEVEFAFRWGIRTLKWSPDSKLLAFAAQIDGPSSDVYIFNVEDRTIRKLTNELENIWSIDWSPDGEKILYLNSIPRAVYSSEHFHIADPKTQNVQTPRQIDGGAFWFGEGWIDENSYFLWDGGEGAPPSRFRYINTKTQKVITFGEYESDGFVYLKDLGGIIVNIYPDQKEASIDSLEPGTYFVSILESGVRVKLSNDRFFPFGKQSLEDSFFVLNGRILYTMKLDGSISPPVSKMTGQVDIFVSPNKEWFVLNNNNDKTEIYSRDLQLIQTWDIQTYETIWRPDSTGFFLEGYPNLYYVSVKDEDFNLVDVCPSRDCPIRNYIWLP